MYCVENNLVNIPKETFLNALKPLQKQLEEYERKDNIEKESY